MFDRNPDPALDELTELSAVLSNADYAYIGWMDFNRLWFKSQFGFKAAEQPRSSTACQWLLENGEATAHPAMPARMPAFLPRGFHCGGKTLPLLRRRPARFQLPTGDWHAGGAGAGCQTALARNTSPCLRCWAARWSRGWNSTPASAPRSRRSAPASGLSAHWPSSAALWPLRWTLFLHWWQCSTPPAAPCG